MNSGDSDEVVHDRYSRMDPGTPSFSTTALKNQTGKILEIAMREPVELTSHGRPKVFLVPVGLMRKFLTLEEQEDARRYAGFAQEDAREVEEARALLEPRRDEASLRVKPRAARARPAAKKPLAAGKGKARSARAGSASR